MSYACWAFASLIIVLRVQVLPWSRLAIVYGPHRVSFLFVFRIAIWNRNTAVSLISAGVWSGGLTLQIRSTPRVPDCFRHHLMAPAFAY
jgi:hypothetical protein